MFGLGLLDSTVLGMGGAVAITAGLLLAAGFHTGVGCIELHVHYLLRLQNFRWWFRSDLNRGIVDYEPSPLDH